MPSRLDGNWNPDMWMQAGNWRQVSGVPDLDRLRWQSRVIVVWAENAKDQRLTRQESSFKKNNAGLNERDVKVFSLTGETPDTQSLRTKLGIDHRPFAVVLIGKDGSVKVRKYTTVDPEELFHTIDRMPMRKDEMNCP